MSHAKSSYFTKYYVTFYILSGYAVWQQQRHYTAKDFLYVSADSLGTESTSCIPTRKHQWGQIWPTECSALECFKSSPSISISMHWNTPWLVDRNKVDRCRVSATYIYNIAWERMSFKRPGISFYEKCRNTVKSPLGTKSPAHLSSIRGHYKFTENQWSKFHAMECWRLLEENPQA